MRIAAALFRLWVVLSVLWLAGLGAYVVVSWHDLLGVHSHNTAPY
jgi:hypothetical protein